MKGKLNYQIHIVYNEFYTNLIVPLRIFWKIFLVCKRGRWSISFTWNNHLPGNKTLLQVRNMIKKKWFNQHILQYGIRLLSKYHLIINQPIRHHFTFRFILQINSMLVVHMWQVAGVIYISTDTLDNSPADTLAGSDTLSFSINVIPMFTHN